MALAALVTLLIIGAQPARAGTWMLVSCANPDGSVAPTDGWSAFTQGPVTVGDGNNTRCSPGVPMSAALGNVAAAQNGQSETLQFTPPAGSTLVGGSLNVNLTAYGGNYSPPYGGATAQADILEPQDSLDQSNTVFSCINQFGCGGSGYAYSGAVTLPANRAGNLYVTAICTALGTFKCDTNIGGSNGYWALAQVSSAHLLLANPAAPQAAGFSGSALQRGARGVAHLVFTATDPNGPGIYAVTAAIDGRPVFSATPNLNNGACVPVGTDGSGALMFDFGQPCPPTEVVDVPVPTSGIPDGSHTLAVTVTDAARNSSTVLDQNITTSNPQTTPTPSGRRAIIALVSVDGQPRSRAVVTRYAAVGPFRPGRVHRLRIRRRGASFTVSFRGVRGAARYLVRLDASDGRHLQEVIPASRHLLRIRALGYFDHLRVTVTGLSPFGRSGPAARARG